MSFPLRALQTSFVLGLLAAIHGHFAPQKPLTRHFANGTEERFQVTLSVKVESHSVRTETVAAQTYVTPVAGSAETSLQWRSVRRVLAVGSNGIAQIEEVVTPTGKACDDLSAGTDRADSALQKSLADFCKIARKEVTVRYSENSSGLSQESGQAALLPLGESAPPLLALWLRRATRPDVIFPSLPFEAGATAQQALQPSSELMKGAHGSETSEWLDAPQETPAATLHVVQQLSWMPSPSAAPASTGTNQPPSNQKETFFADSLTTVSLLDGSLLHASRTASRSNRRVIDPVPGLAAPPDFSSKITLSVAIERLP